MNNNWISVDVDLPEYNKEVLVNVKELGVFTGDLISMKTGAGMKWRLFRKRYQIKVSNIDVTHWMHMPEPI